MVAGVNIPFVQLARSISSVGPFVHKTGENLLF